MKKLDIRKDLYNCCPLLNKECTKENCYINDGPCRLTCDYNQSQEYLIEKTKLFHKNGVFSLEYDKETLRDMVLEYQEKIDKAVNDMQGTLGKYNYADTRNSRQRVANAKLLKEIKQLKKQLIQ